MCVCLLHVYTHGPFLQGGQVRGLTAPRNKVYLFKLLIIIYLSIGHTMKLPGSEFLNQGLNWDPALEAWSPNHWTTRELPRSPFEKIKLLFFPSSSQGRFVLSREQPFTSLGNQNPLLEFLQQVAEFQWVEVMNLWPVGISPV